MTIPASAIVSVNPAVLSAGGRALNLNGLMLTTNTQAPIGSVISFATSADVSTYFGSTSAEYTAASKYFLGFEGSNIKPGSLLFSQYNTVAVAAYLRGASVAALTLAELQALSGTLIITVNGVVKTSSTINLAAASSFSNAATIITAGFTAPGFVVTYDTVSGGFLFTNSATGVTSTLTYCTGTLSTSLKLTSATGAVLSQGADAIATPSAGMTAIVALTTNWATFMTIFNPDVTGNANKQLFAAWTGLQNHRYAYVAWDTDITPTQSTTATSSLGYLLAQSQTSGTVPIYSPDYNLAAFLCGAVASLDFTQKNGRATMAFKSQSGLTSSVTTQPAADNLIANGYNFYGSYATANDQFTFFYPGSITGIFKWVDSYANEIWLNNSFQLALMTLLTNTKSLPYNDAGYGLERSACLDPIEAGLNFGAFQVGVPLSTQQAANVNNAAGVAIDRTLTSQGWYLQILPATAQVRGNRASPPMTFWYMDGGSIQKISLASIAIQ